jgi:hypothetical protein
MWWLIVAASLEHRLNSCDLPPVWHFRIGDGVRLHLPDDLPVGKYDDLLSQDEDGKYIVIRADLGGDAADAWIVQHDSCGTGGCPYQVFAGGTHADRGGVFGWLLWASPQTSYGVHTLCSLSKSDLVEYRFNGTRYDGGTLVTSLAADDYDRLTRRVLSSPRAGAATTLGQIEGHGIESQIGANSSRSATFVAAPALNSGSTSAAGSCFECRNPTSMPSREP